MQVGKAMASTEDKSIKIMRMLDVDYVLIIFGGMIGYSGDDINKFLWMVNVLNFLKTNLAHAWRLFLVAPVYVVWQAHIWPLVLDDFYYYFWNLRTTTDTQFKAAFCRTWQQTENKQCTFSTYRFSVLLEALIKDCVRRWWPVKLVRPRKCTVVAKKQSPSENLTTSFRMKKAFWDLDLNLAWFADCGCDWSTVLILLARCAVITCCAVTQITIMTPQTCAQRNRCNDN